MSIFSGILTFRGLEAGFTSKIRVSISPEVHDITLRTDRELANFFRFLDSEIGLQDVLIVLTSDHGVAPVPEFSQRTRAMGGRISPEEIRAAVNQALSREFGAAIESRPKRRDAHLNK